MRMSRGGWRTACSVSRRRRAPTGLRRTFYRNRSERDSRRRSRRKNRSPHVHVGGEKNAEFWERALARERKLSLARQDALTIRAIHSPTRERVGYGSYA